MFWLALLMLHNKSENMQSHLQANSHLLLHPVRSLIWCPFNRLVQRWIMCVTVLESCWTLCRATFPQTKGKIYRWRRCECKLNIPLTKQTLTFLVWEQHPHFYFILSVSKRMKERKRQIWNILLLFSGASLGFLIHPPDSALFLENRCSVCEPSGLTHQHFVISTIA